VRSIQDRFKRADFFAALDAKREREGVSWRAVARETGVSPSSLSRLARGKNPDMRTFALLAAWLRADIRPFFVGSHGYRASNADEARVAQVAADALQRLYEERKTLLRQKRLAALLSADAFHLQEIEQEIDRWEARAKPTTDPSSDVWSRLNSLAELVAGLGTSVCESDVATLAAGADARAQAAAERAGQAHAPSVHLV
jgi:transcriptional regulator with XRE-family HTH domain